MPALVPVLTSTNVVCQPLPVAMCAMEPPPVPTLASAGIVVSVLLDPERRRADTQDADLPSSRRVELNRSALARRHRILQSITRKKCVRCRRAKAVRSRRAISAAGLVANHHGDHCSLRRTFSTATPSTTPLCCRKPRDTNSRCAFPSAPRLPAPSRIRWKIAKPSTAPVAASCAEPTNTGGVCGPLSR